MFEKYKIKLATLDSHLNSFCSGSPHFRYNYEEKWKDFYSQLLSLATGINGIAYLERHTSTGVGRKDTICKPDDEIEYILRFINK